MSRIEPSLSAHNIELVRGFGKYNIPDLAYVATPPTSPGETLMPATDTVQQETLIDADPATIFAFLTDADRLVRWMGVAANLDPKPGGLYLVDVTNGDVARGEFKEVVPVSRLAYS